MQRWCVLGCVATAPLLALPVAAHAAQIETIPAIQGTGHVSPFDGAVVRFEGVVTQLQGGTFFVQDPIGDGDERTSDAILVRRKPAGLAGGDRVSVEGTVEEQGRFGHFTTTTIKDPVIRKIGNAAVPSPIVIGAGGRRPPTEAIVLPGGGFDPVRSGADFFETLEGMQVRIEWPVVVGPTSSQNSFFVVADAGRGATGMNSLGGITATPGDSNPERIRVDVARPLDAEALQVSVGDRFSKLEGAVVTDNGSYGVQLAAFSDLTRRPPAADVAAPAQSAEVLKIASYNVENLDPRVEDPAKLPPDTKPDDDTGKFAAIAQHVVGPLGSPDIVALQEVQDNDGGEFSDVTSANLTLKTLTEAIRQAGGPPYESVSLDPVDDLEGGQPGGNIRVAFLYNPTRVQPVSDSARRIEDPSFARTRLPLAATFRFGKREVVAIDIHFSSKGGSDPLYGPNQPPRDPSGAFRFAQARAVRQFIRTLAPDPERSVVVLGDFNAFWYEEPLLLLTGGEPLLANLALADPPVERVSYVFEGNGQSLDHALVALGERQTAELTTLHLNSGMPERQQTSDHDPKLVRIRFP